MTDAASKLPIQPRKQSEPARSEGWPPFESLRREIDRLFEDFHPFGWSPPSRGGDLSRALRGAWPVAPAMDMVEKEAEFEITAELPGIDEKNIEISVGEDALTIKGVKTEEKEQSEKDYHISERRYGAFQRSFALPRGIDADRIEAKVAKGVLSVTLPKSAEAQKQAKKIAVKSA